MVSRGVWGAASYLQAVLVARGASKAMWIHDEAILLVEVLTAMVDRAKSIIRRLWRLDRRYHDNHGGNDGGSEAGNPRHNGTGKYG